MKKVKANIHNSDSLTQISKNTTPKFLPIKPPSQNTHMPLNPF